MIIKIPKPNRYSSIHIQITTGCNMEPRCSICRHNKRKGRNMEKGVFEGIIKKAKRHKCRFVSLGGGEPTLHPELSYFIALCRGQSLRVAMTTNGLKLVDTSFDRVHVSYDAYHDYSPNRALRHYRKLGAQVGINHIFTNFELFRSVYEKYRRRRVDILLIKEKPDTLTTQEEYDKLRDFLSSHPSSGIMLDPCLSLTLYGRGRGYLCHQGRYATYFDIEGREWICSNQKYYECPAKMW
ncbi:MAG: hypothetical protein DRO95_06175 [Candidatus Altiarchaeales archaeon]|nr:MAG: hypothetical protein DRO95_06175 [Candidatus Altiarchaeales archaeon]